MIFKASLFKEKKRISKNYIFSKKNFLGKKKYNFLFKFFKNFLSNTKNHFNFFI